MGSVVSSSIDSMIEVLSRKPSGSWRPKILNEPEPALELPTASTPRAVGRRNRGLGVRVTVEAGPLVAVRGRLGGLACGGFFSLVWRVTGGKGFRFGDVRLMAVVGVVTGAHSVQLTIWAVLAVASSKCPGAFAYGPALSLGPFPGPVGRGYRLLCRGLRSTS